MTDEEKKKEILELLKNGELSTGKIAYKISCIQYKAEELLEELEKSKKVISEKRGKGTYWRLKK
jgi:hypothetical protein